AAERRFNEAVFVDSCESCKVRNQTDVRTFGRLNRAHTAVVAVMNVTDFESGAVTGKTAGAEGGKSSLMGKFCKGVGLVHELGQRRRTEELFNSRHNRADVYKRCGRDLIGFLRLQSHALFDHALHTGEADTE